jgi:hypothetical protein
VWRLGQKNDVMVWFLAHAGTVEANLLSRMGKKKRAAQLLYGKSAGGVLVEQEGSDVMTELLRDALDGKIATNAREAIKDIHIFVDETKVPKVRQKVEDQEPFATPEEFEFGMIDTPEIIPAVPLDELPVAEAEPVLETNDPQPHLPISTQKKISTSKSPFDKFAPEPLKKFKPQDLQGKTVQFGLFGDFVEVVKKKKKD